MNLSDLKTLLREGDPAFWPQLAALTRTATAFDDILFLSTLRKKAVACQLPQPPPSGQPLRLALLGGCSLYPLHELLTHLLAVEGCACELFVGDFDNYTAEIMDAQSRLIPFRPQVVVLLPAARHAKYTEAITDPRETVAAAAITSAKQLDTLCRTAHERTGAEILLANFPLPARHDPGEIRTRLAASDTNYRKLLNLELGLNAPAGVRICDLEFLAARLGTFAAEDARGWFESKQPGSPAFLVELARELARLILSRHTPSKKVLVLDLDDTLWGGIVAEEGLENIELGDTSPRGEAFKAFQRYVASQKERGVLLAVCSKNDEARAREPFAKHPEMVLRETDFVAFKANWQPKADNLREIAAELNLGLDSLVFVDDNPAEIEIVRQFAPEVTALLLAPDPAERVGQLQDSRLFEPHTLTAEDAQRTAHYHTESQRQVHLASHTDMDAYLASLDMKATIGDFTQLDAPRLAQLINKSNQFNLTTRRRTETEVRALIGQPDHVCFSVRLSDRFGDHGLIAIIIGNVRGDALEIDTWLMSCRVLKRQVEEEALNELARRTAERGCQRLFGIYLPTPKNDMVRDFYPRMGFKTIEESPAASRFALELAGFEPIVTKIKVVRRSAQPD